MLEVPGASPRESKPGMEKRGSAVARMKTFDGVRALVSKKKNRFTENGFDLDLSYITPRIIAMGYPSEGLEGAYRNNMQDVQRFFTHYHAGHYRIYNLCAEREYSLNHFESCCRYPFEDHNTCPFKLLCDICEDCHNFLAADPANVVSLHCKAGKGRTGTVISALLIREGMASNADEAMNVFGKARTRNNKGVTIPSQQRWVQYYQYYYHNFWKVNAKFPFSLSKPIRVTGFFLTHHPNFDVGGGCDPYFKVKNAAGKTLYDQLKDKHNKVKAWRKSITRLITCEIDLVTDVKFIFFDWDAMSKDDKMFSFWINPAFITSRSITLKKGNLDGAVKDKKCEKFHQDFSIKIIFDGVPNATEEEEDMQCNSHLFIPEPMQKKNKHKKKDRGASPASTNKSIKSQDLDAISVSGRGSHNMDHSHASMASVSHVATSTPRELPHMLDEDTDTDGDGDTDDEEEEDDEDGGGQTKEERRSSMKEHHKKRQSHRDDVPPPPPPPDDDDPPPPPPRETVVERNKDNDDDTHNNNSKKHQQNGSSKNVPNAVDKPAGCCNVL